MSVCFSVFAAGGYRESRYPWDLSKMRYCVVLLLPSRLFRAHALTQRFQVQGLASTIHVSNGTLVTIVLRVLPQYARSGVSLSVYAFYRHSANSGREGRSVRRSKIGLGVRRSYLYFISRTCASPAGGSCIQLPPVGCRRLLAIFFLSAHSLPQPVSPQVVQT